MVAVRMPAIPATMDRLLTDMTSCRRPTPEAPIRPEIYTWNEVPAIRSSRLTAVSSNALKKIGTCRRNRIPPCPHSMARGVGVCCGWLILGFPQNTYSMDAGGILRILDAGRCRFPARIKRFGDRNQSFPQAEESREAAVPPFPAPCPG